jgi:hypothetical protein
MQGIGPDSPRTSFILAAPQANQQQLRQEEDEAERRVDETPDDQNLQAENTTTGSLGNLQQNVGAGQNEQTDTPGNMMRNMQEGLRPGLGERLNTVA